MQIPKNEKHGFATGQRLASHGGVCLTNLPWVSHWHREFLSLTPRWTHLLKKFDPLKINAFTITWHVFKFYFNRSWPVIRLTTKRITWLTQSCSWLIIFINHMDNLRMGPISLVWNFGTSHTPRGRSFFSTRIFFFCVEAPLIGYVWQAQKRGKKSFIFIPR